MKTYVKLTGAGASFNAGGGSGAGGGAGGGGIHLASSRRDSRRNRGGTRAMTPAMLAALRAAVENDGIVSHCGLPVILDLMHGRLAVKSKSETAISPAFYIITDAGRAAVACKKESAS